MPWARALIGNTTISVSKTRMNARYIGSPPDANSLRDDDRSGRFECPDHAFDLSKFTTSIRAYRLGKSECRG
jgi:hypothetical protein